VLKEAPFSVAFSSERELCTVDVGRYLIKTYVYMPA
jgi:hypothetical protein